MYQWPMKQKRKVSTLLFSKKLLENRKATAFLSVLWWVLWLALLWLLSRPVLARQNGVLYIWVDDMRETVYSIAFLKEAILEDDNPEDDSEDGNLEDDSEDDNPDKKTYKMSNQIVETGNIGGTRIGESLYIFWDNLTTNKDNTEGVLLHENQVSKDIYGHILWWYKNFLTTKNVTIVAWEENYLTDPEANATILWWERNQLWTGDADSNVVLLWWTENRVWTPATNGGKWGSIIWWENNKIEFQSSDSTILWWVWNEINWSNVIVWWENIKVGAGKDNIFAYSNNSDSNSPFEPEEGDAFYLKSVYWLGINMPGTSWVSSNWAVGFGEIDINANECNEANYGVQWVWNVDVDWETVGCLVWCTKRAMNYGGGRWELLDRWEMCENACRFNNANNKCVVFPTLYEPATVEGKCTDADFLDDKLIAGIVFHLAENGQLQEGDDNLFPFNKCSSSENKYKDVVYESYLYDATPTESCDQNAEVNQCLFQCKDWYHRMRDQTWKIELKEDDGNGWLKSAVDENWNIMTSLDKVNCYRDCDVYDLNGNLHALKHNEIGIVYDTDVENCAYNDNTATWISRPDTNPIRFSTFTCGEHKHNVICSNGTLYDYNNGVIGDKTENSVPYPEFRNYMGKKWYNTCKLNDYTCDSHYVLTWYDLQWWKYSEKNPYLTELLNLDSIDEDRTTKSWQRWNYKVCFNYDPNNSEEGVACNVRDFPYGNGREYKIMSCDLTGWYEPFNSKGDLIPYYIDGSVSSDNVIYSCRKKCEWHGTEYSDSTVLTLYSPDNSCFKNKGCHTENFACDDGRWKMGNMYVQNDVVDKYTEDCTAEDYICSIREGKWINGKFLGLLSDATLNSDFGYTYKTWRDLSIYGDPCEQYLANGMSCKADPHDGNEFYSLASCIEDVSHVDTTDTKYTEGGQVLWMSSPSGEPKFCVPNKRECGTLVSVPKWERSDGEYVELIYNYDKGFEKWENWSDDKYYSDWQWSDKSCRVECPDGAKADYVGKWLWACTNYSCDWPWGYHDPDDYWVSDFSTFVPNNSNEETASCANSISSNSCTYTCGGDYRCPVEGETDICVPQSKPCNEDKVPADDGTWNWTYFHSYYDGEEPSSYQCENTSWGGGACSYYCTKWSCDSDGKCVEEPEPYCAWPDINDEWRDNVRYIRDNPTEQNQTPICVGKYNEDENLSESKCSRWCCFICNSWNECTEDAKGCKQIWTPSCLTNNIDTDGAILASGTDGGLTAATESILVDKEALSLFVNRQHRKCVYYCDYWYHPEGANSLNGVWYTNCVPDEPDPDKCSIEYNPNGWTPKPDRAEGNCDFKPAEAPTPEPSKSCYVFDGWYKESSLKTIWRFNKDEVTTDNPSITLYAKWNPKTYNVTISCGNKWNLVGSNSKQKITYSKGTPKKISISCEVKSSYVNDYEFLWWTVTNGKNKTISWGSGDDIPDAYMDFLCDEWSLTLNADYLDKRNCKVIFDWNGGMINWNTTKEISKIGDACPLKLNTSDIPSESDLTTDSCKTFTNQWTENGRNFEDWSSVSVEKGKVRRFSANWAEITYTATLNPNSNEGSICLWGECWNNGTNKTITSITTKNAKGNCCFTIKWGISDGEYSAKNDNPNLVFAGWYNSKTGWSKVWDGKGSYEVCGNETLYARWQEVYSLTFDRNWGEWTDKTTDAQKTSSRYVKGTKYSTIKSAMNIGVTKDGKNPKWWYTNPQCTSIFTDADWDKPIEGNTILYACWEPIPSELCDYGDNDDNDDQIWLCRTTPSGITKWWDLEANGSKFTWTCKLWKITDNCEIICPDDKPTATVTSKSQHIWKCEDKSCPKPTIEKVYLNDNGYPYVRVSVTGNTDNIKSFGVKTAYESTFDGRYRYHDVSAKNQGTKIIVNGVALLQLPKDLYNDNAGISDSPKLDSGKGDSTLLENKNNDTLTFSSYLRAWYVKVWSNCGTDNTSEEDMSDFDFNPRCSESKAKSCEEWTVEDSGNTSNNTWKCKSKLINDVSEVCCQSVIEREITCPFGYKLNDAGTMCELSFRICAKWALFSPSPNRNYYWLTRGSCFWDTSMAISYGTNNGGATPDQTLERMGYAGPWNGYAYDSSNGGVGWEHGIFAGTYGTFFGKNDTMWDWGPYLSLEPYDTDASSNGCGAWAFSWGGIVPTCEKARLQKPDEFKNDDAWYILVKCDRWDIDITNHPGCIKSETVAATGVDSKLCEVPQTNTTSSTSNNYSWWHGWWCFLAWTPVITLNWFKNIEDIQVGDYVLSYDTVKWTTEYNMVTKRFVHENNDDELYELVIDGNLLKVTYLHGFYVVDREDDWYSCNLYYRWKFTKDLKVWDTLMMSDGKYVTIDSISHYPNYSTVYNLEVENLHNYYVWEWYLVHNGVFYKATFAVDDREWWGGCWTTVNAFMNENWGLCGSYNSCDGSYSLSDC